MQKDTIYIQAIGWNKKHIANWSYRYYKITSFSNSIELLSYNGIYSDTFGSVENIISKIRTLYHDKEKGKNIDMVIDYSMSDLLLPMRAIKKLCSDKKLDGIIDVLDTK